MRSILTEYHWEEWPAVLLNPHATPGNPSVIVDLLDPNGIRHVQAQVFWKPAHIPALEPGENGRLWFAGDLRFGGVIALPGGINPAPAVFHDGLTFNAGDRKDNQRAYGAGMTLHPMFNHGYVGEHFWDRGA